MGSIEEKIWLDGEDLSGLFEQLVEAEARRRTFHPPDFPEDPHLSDTSFSQSLQALAQGISQLQHRADLERRVKGILEEKMLRGEYTAYGVWRDENDTAHIKAIPANAWLDADISPMGNVVENGPHRFTRVRVSVKDSSDEPQDNSERIIRRDDQVRGRPSQAKLIKEAIAECERNIPELWGLPPGERRKFYFAYLLEATGVNAIRQSGFSQKTIEKYEAHHKRAKG